MPLVVAAADCVHQFPGVYQIKIIHFFMGQFRSAWFLGLLLCLPGSLPAEQNSYDDVVNGIFWQKLYSQGGWSLYCGFRFDSAGRTATGGHVRIDHIYPMKRMIEQLQCGSRQQCRDSGNPDFIAMEADLHNLYPVWWEISSTNLDTRFGEIEGEEWRFENCDYERRFGVIEPRPIARGNIARALLYMQHRYGIELDRQTLELMQQWNTGDPPSRQEKNRNNIIESIQGNRNPYIDNPQLANRIVVKD